ncbi:hypothetical protein DQ354_15830 [Arthrobacter sp. AQ5-06]|nr:hypothetical protein DQ354_15830 [Arthrobacter sp. AQ5-06]
MPFNVRNVGPPARALRSGNYKVPTSMPKGVPGAIFRREHDGGTRSWRVRPPDVGGYPLNVYSTFPNHRFALASQYNRSQGYDIGSGTSMASPIVAAVASLAWSSHTGATNASVRANVETSGGIKAGTEAYWAHGRVNADRAVR